MGMTFKTPERRFVGGHSPVTKESLLMIADYKWWCSNETAILKWMDENLTYGRDQQTGMIITFNSAEELSWFLLRWQA